MNSLGTTPKRARRLRIDNTKPDPVESAQEAGLKYVDEMGPGIRRKRAGPKGFSYVQEPTGRRVMDESTLARIKSLVIPPAWEQVWICPSSNGHIQAIGRD